MRVCVSAHVSGERERACVCCVCVCVVCMVCLWRARNAEEYEWSSVCMLDISPRQQMEVGMYRYQEYAWYIGQQGRPIPPEKEMDQDGNPRMRTRSASMHFADNLLEDSSVLDLVGDFSAACTPSLGAGSGEGAAGAGSGAGAGFGRGDDTSSEGSGSGSGSESGGESSEEDAGNPGRRGPPRKVSPPRWGTCPVG